MGRKKIYQVKFDYAGWLKICKGVENNVCNSTEEDPKLVWERRSFEVKGLASINKLGGVSASWLNSEYNIAPLYSLLSQEPDAQLR